MVLPVVGRTADTVILVGGSNVARTSLTPPVVKLSTQVSAAIVAVALAVVVIGFQLGSKLSSYDEHPAHPANTNPGSLVASFGAINLVTIAGLV